MDETEHMDASIIKGLFDQGVSFHIMRDDGIQQTHQYMYMQLMGIETEAEYDGSNCSFTSAIIVIEGIYRQLSK